VCREIQEISEIIFGSGRSQRSERSSYWVHREITETREVVLWGSQEITEVKESCNLRSQGGQEIKEGIFLISPAASTEVRGR
jgi:hypothetical protein